MAAASPLLALSNLGKIYGSGAPAVRDVNIEVRRGEFVTLLGPSGSGKTTILKMIAGFEEPSEGQILLDGRSVVHRPPHEREIGMVFQNYALFPHLTVAQNIGFPLDLRRMPQSEIDSRVRRILELVRLPDLGERYPNQLSGGQQQRVALARAVVFEPRLVLMDEPLGALDRNLREQLKGEIKRVQLELGMTVIYVTHDQDEALVLSDRIAVMRDGRLEQLTTAGELYRSPANRFVANFIGESNLLAFERMDLADGPKLKLSCGAVLEGPPRAVKIPGNGWLLVRPEAIDMMHGSSQPLGGIIRSAVFLGEATRYAVDTGQGPMSVKLQNRQGRAFEIGQEVSLLWHPQDSAILVE